MTDPPGPATPSPGVRRHVAAWAVTAVVVAGAIALFHARAGLPTPDFDVIVILWVATVLAGVVVVELDLGGVRESVAPVEIAVVPLMVLLPPHWAIAVAATAFPVVHVVITRGVLQKVVFNTAMNLTATALGAAVFHWFAGPGFTATGQDLLAAALAALTYVVTTAIAFSGLLARLSGRSWRAQEAWQRVPLDLGAGLTGVLAAALAVRVPAALPLLALPTVMDYLRGRSRRASLQLEVAKRQAEAANQAKNEFLSQMSHELRTPLNAILGFGQLLELSALDEDDAEAATQIVRAGRHLLALIDDVLDLSRIDAGTLGVELEPVHIVDLLTAAVALIQPMAHARSIRLTLQPEDCDGFVLADRRRCHQALLNLLSNAVKYNHDGGSVTVLCERRDDSTTRIGVRDTGPGISTDRRDQLFEPFERLGAEGSGVEGTGLGLALTKRLIEAMGGVIGVDSVPGKGSTFWFELSVTTPAAEHS